MSPEELTKQRGANYGHPKKNFQLIADYWTVYLQEKLKPGCRITREDIPPMNILTKLAREQYSHQPDNYLDIKGYAHTGEMLYESEEGKNL